VNVKDEPRTKDHDQGVAWPCSDLHVVDVDGLEAQLGQPTGHVLEEVPDSKSIQVPEMPDIEHTEEVLEDGKKRTSVRPHCKVSDIQTTGWSLRPDLQRWDGIFVLQGQHKLNEGLEILYGGDSVA
jgi:hypothetical protein